MGLVLGFLSSCFSWLVFFFLVCWAYALRRTDGGICPESCGRTDGGTTVVAGAGVAWLGDGDRDRGGEGSSCM